MKVELLDHTKDAAFNICFAARTCYNSWDKDKPKERGEFIKALIKAKHETPLEFAHTMWHITGISRICQNQIVRHRIASYCVMSQRYVDSSDLDCILPVSVLELTDSAYDLAKSCRDLYKKLVENGVPKEDARMLLPQGTETQMCMDMNFRSLRHFMQLRLDKHAQWETRQVAREIYLACKELFPWLVADISQ